MTSSFSLPAEFPPPPEGRRPDLLVVAGEHSGDQHAAVAVRKLLERNPGLTVVALGGAALRDTRATFLYDMTRSSVVGVFEVIRHFGFFRELFGKILDWIERYRPRAVCFVDNPGLNLRLCKALHRRGLSVQGGGDIRLLYYIAPQVWAWKGKRRFSMARHLDALAVIFPFEVESFADTDLEVTFVGHPYLAEDFRPLVRYDPEGTILLLPGSRRIAVGRILPALLGGFARLLEEKPNERATVITPDDEVRALAECELESRPNLKDRVTFADKDDTVRGKAVLTSSGTMSLTCALAGIPGAIVYRVGRVTYWLGRVLITIPYLGIANLLLKKPMYPEYLQERASPRNLAAELRDCLESPARLEATHCDTAHLRARLAAPGRETVDRWLEKRVIAEKNDGGQTP